jgi:hypothetical protein
MPVFISDRNRHRLLLGVPLVGQVSYRWNDLADSPCAWAEVCCLRGSTDLVPVEIRLNHLPLYEVNDHGDWRLPYGPQDMGLPRRRIDLDLPLPLVGDRMELVILEPPGERRRGVPLARNWRFAPWTSPCLYV